MIAAEVMDWPTPDMNEFLDDVGCSDAEVATISGRGRGRGFGGVVGVGEVQRELWRRRRRCGGLGDDALAQAMVAGERGRGRWSRRGDSCRRRRGSSAAARTVSRARGAGRRARAAGGQRGVEVVVGGADDLVDLGEHGGHALRRGRWRGQKAQLAVALLLVRAVGDQTVQVLPIFLPSQNLVIAP